jgi:hypothetical protein
LRNQAGASSSRIQDSPKSDKVAALIPNKEVILAEVASLAGPFPAKLVSLSEGALVEMAPSYLSLPGFPWLSFIEQ